MELILKNQSRYLNTELFVKDGVRFWGLWKQISFPPRRDDNHITVTRDEEGMRVDYLAYKYLGSYELWWVICQANNLENPFIQLSSTSTYAHTTTIFEESEGLDEGIISRECLRIHSMNAGDQWNTEGRSGLKIRIYPDRLQVFMKNQPIEFFSGMSSYMWKVDPTNPNKDSGEPNPKFWGNLKSSYIRAEWLSPDVHRGITGINPPILTGGMLGKEYHFMGGSTHNRTLLRIPSISHVMEKLYL